MFNTEGVARQPVSPQEALFGNLLKQLPIRDLSNISEGQFEMLAGLKALHADSRKETQELLNEDDSDQVEDEMENR